MIPAMRFDKDRGKWFVQLQKTGKQEMTNGLVLANALLGNISNFFPYNDFVNK